MKNDIYTDIATRTGGDIYIGVVGPVRTGKSTFIKQFMEQFVIPNIESDYRKERAIDELPQSSAGKTIMTTEPKFIPEEAVNITLEGGASFNVRMIDCVGYIIPSAIGYIENEAPRMVVTPWFDTEVPFNMAAEVGTQKVITEHSTIGLVVTTDGSITDLPREEYEECEERIIDELKQIGKPFVVLMNTTEPYSQQTKDLCEQLSDKYGTTVMPINCLELSEKEIKEILTLLLYSFPVKEINISMPSWINSLDKGHWLKEAVFGHIKEAASAVTNLRDISDCAEKICCCEQVSSGSVAEIDLGKGSAVIKVELDPALFFRIIGEATGLEIKDENDLMPRILELVKIKERFSKFSSALDEMEKTGYGIVMPEMNELTLDEPEIIKQGGKYGVRLKAAAPAIHLLKTTINTEVAPIVGSEKQSEELVLYMLNDFEESPEKIWESNIFGKSLHELVSEGLHTKLSKLPEDARMKIKERFSKFSSALDEMEKTGYGIVMPEMNELTLDEPEIIKQGGKYGVRLKAAAPAIHLLKTTINTEVAPIVGSEKQSEELVLYMLNDFEESPEKIWESNIFGKSLHELVSEGLHTKLSKLPEDARMKIKETIERMINEGCSGLICFIL